jgi:ADP-heptose:LPS heptosyltransferase
MERNWSGKQNILCIRLDNIGDVIMTSPAIRALKGSFKSKITLLTSSMAGGIAKHIPAIDEVIVSDVPWVKSKSNEGAPGFYSLAESLRKKKFDAAVIFTVYSQNPMPAIMLAYLAGIPDRLAYCRENPYDLLTVWIPDKEPYSFINHQVLRDIQLVAHVGATVKNDELLLEVPNSSYAAMESKLQRANIRFKSQWMIVHPGASEIKREYPVSEFKTILRKIVDNSDLHIIFTGTASEKMLIETLRSGIEERSASAAGLLSIDEFMALIDIAPVVLSVNTGTVHIAAALKTPVVVLYAMTNPQHTPWKVQSKVFPYPVAKDLESKNEVLRYMKEHMTDEYSHPTADEVVQAVMKLMRTVNQQPSLQYQNRAF